MSGQLSVWMTSHRSNVQASPPPLLADKCDQTSKSLFLGRPIATNSFLLIEERPSHPSQIILTLVGLLQLLLLQ